MRAQQADRVRCIGVLMNSIAVSCRALVAGILVATDATVELIFASSTPRTTLKRLVTITHQVVLDRRAAGDVIVPSAKGQGRQKMSFWYG